MYNDIIRFANYPYTITPLKGTQKHVFMVNSSMGVVINPYASVKNELSAIPTLYLKSNINIVDGTGAKDNPYILSQD